MLMQRKSLPLLSILGLFKASHRLRYLIENEKKVISLLKKGQWDTPRVRKVLGGQR